MMLPSRSVTVLLLFVLGFNLANCSSSPTGFGSFKQQKTAKTQKINPVLRSKATSPNVMHQEMQKMVRVGCLRLASGDQVILKEARTWYEMVPDPMANATKRGVVDFSSVNSDYARYKNNNFRVWVRNGAKGLITLQYVRTGQFLFTDKKEDGKVMASLGSKPSFYKVLASGAPSESEIVLQDAETGMYMSTIGTRMFGFRSDDSMKTRIGVTVEKVKGDAVLISNCVILRSGDKIALKTREGLYVKRVEGFPSPAYSGMVAYKATTDEASMFTVTVADKMKGTVYLQADNGQYLKRFCCWMEENVIASYLDEPDAFSPWLFKATILSVGQKEVLMYAENGWIVNIKPKSYDYSGKMIDAAVIQENISWLYAGLGVEFV